MEWYSEVEYSDGITFEQGDILKDCPYYNVTRDEDDCKTEIKLYNVVILTQSCDMANGKIDKVLVAPWLPLSDIFAQDLAFKQRKNPQKLQLSKDDKRSSFKHLKDGVRPGYHMLNKDPEVGLYDFPIVDFKNTYSIPLREMLEVAKKQGRFTRMNSPYKEHLSQAFARFFMRVGLPATIENPYEK